MRWLLPICLACVAAASSIAAAAREASSAPGKSSVRYEYRTPANPDLRPLQDELSQRRVLEQFSEVLSALRLPRTLTLRFAGCNGTSNAWYDPEKATVTFCYEYVKELVDLAAQQDLQGVPLEEARDGPVAFVMLHETGHAVFDLLKVPIMGREEDAADIFAAVVLLRMGKGVALRVLRGAAWQYGTIARKEKFDPGALADVHGLDSQRYYNLLCMAYGSDPEYFAGAIERGHLPNDRAEGCAEEYGVALYAMKKLILPSLDLEQAKQLRAKHGKRWGTPSEAP